MVYRAVPGTFGGREKSYQPGVLNSYFKCVVGKNVCVYWEGERRGWGRRGGSPLLMQLELVVCAF